MTWIQSLEPHSERRKPTHTNCPPIHNTAGTHSHILGGWSKLQWANSNNVTHIHTCVLVYNHIESFYVVLYLKKRVIAVCARARLCVRTLSYLHYHRACRFLSRPPAEDQASLRRGEGRSLKGSFPCGSDWALWRAFEAESASEGGLLAFSQSSSRVSVEGREGKCSLGMLSNVI